jgi:hypothetical protein
VFRSKFGCHLAKNMRFFHKTSGSNFGSNHVAHGDDGNLRIAQDGSKFSLS